MAAKVWQPVLRSNPWRDRLGMAAWRPACEQLGSADAGSLTALPLAGVPARNVASGSAVDSTLLRRNMCKSTLQPAVWDKYAAEWSCTSRAAPPEFARYQDSGACSWLCRPVMHCVYGPGACSGMGAAEAAHMMPSAPSLSQPAAPAHNCQPLAMTVSYPIAAY